MSTTIDSILDGERKILDGSLVLIGEELNSVMDNATLCWRGRSLLAGMFCSKQHQVNEIFHVLQVYTGIFTISVEGSKYSIEYSRMSTAASDVYYDTESEDIEVPELVNPGIVEAIIKSELVNQLDSSRGGKTFIFSSAISIIKELVYAKINLINNSDDNEVLMGIEL